jgi:hypothetical protein
MKTPPPARPGVASFRWGRGYLRREVTEQGLLDTAKLSVLSTVIGLATGVLIVIIRRITAWQSQPRDVA